MAGARDAPRGSGGPPARQVRQRGGDRRAVFIQAFEQAFQMADVRQHGAVEHHLRSDLHQQRGEVLHVFVAQEFGVVLDVDPGEDVPRHGGGQRLQLGLVLLAGVAPGRAEAGHQPGVGR